MQAIRQFRNKTMPLPSYPVASTHAASTAGVYPTLPNSVSTHPPYPSSNPSSIGFEKLSLGKSSSNNVAAPPPYPTQAPYPGVVNPGTAPPTYYPNQQHSNAHQQYHQGYPPQQSGYGYNQQPQSQVHNYPQPQVQSYAQPQPQVQSYPQHQPQVQSYPQHQAQVHNYPHHQPHSNLSNAGNAAMGAVGGAVEAVVGRKNKKALGSIATVLAGGYALKQASKLFGGSWSGSDCSWGSDCS